MCHVGNSSAAVVLQDFSAKRCGVYFVLLRQDSVMDHSVLLDTNRGVINDPEKLRALCCAKSYLCVVAVNMRTV